MKKYKRVSYADRCQISAMLKSNLSIREIATELSFDRSTIYRELKRNKGFGNINSFHEIYSPTIAQRKAMLKGQSRGRKKVLEEEVLRIFVVSA